MKKPFLTLLSILTLSTTTSLPAQAAWNEQTFKSVVQDLNAFWSLVLTEADIPYKSPTVYAHTTDEDTTYCGPLTTAQYCLNTNSVHVDLSAMRDLAYDIGDSAAYVVVAHEYAHSIQQQLGILSPQSSGPQQELQADCLAGTFFASAYYTGRLEPGDFQEALFSAFRAGDYNVGEPGHHGTSLQRALSFADGFSDPRNCF